MSYRHLKVFTAPWCGPCQSLKQVLHDVQITKVEIDIDEQKALADIHQVRGVPTLKLYDGATLLKTHTGLMNRNELDTFLA